MYCEHSAPMGNYFGSRLYSRPVEWVSLGLAVAKALIPGLAFDARQRHRRQTPTSTCGARRASSITYWAPPRRAAGRRPSFTSSTSAAPCPIPAESRSKYRMCLN